MEEVDKLLRKAKLAEEKYKKRLLYHDIQKETIRLLMMPSHRLAAGVMWKKGNKVNRIKM
jgi:hypothetical protein